MLTKCVYVFSQGKSSSTGNLLDKDDIPPPDYSMSSRTFQSPNVSTFKQRPYSVAVPPFPQVRHLFNSEERGPNHCEWIHQSGEALPEVDSKAPSVEREGGFSENQFREPILRVSVVMSSTFGWVWFKSWFLLNFWNGIWPLKNGLNQMAVWVGENELGFRSFKYSCSDYEE